MSRPTGPCTLCGAKRTSSSWRRLPDCAGELAGKDGCNACYVCLTKAASKLDEGAIRELMASRCALKGVAGPARRRLTHSRKAGSSACTVMPGKSPLSGLLRFSFTELLLGVRDGGAAGAGPSRSPGSSPEQQQQQQHASGEASMAHSSGSSSPAMQQEVASHGQERPAAQPPVLPPLLQLGSPGTGSLAGLPLVQVCEDEKHLLDDWIELMRACFQAAGQRLTVAHRAWLNVEQLVGPYAMLAGVLPAMQLLMPGAGRAPQPAGVMLFCVRAPPRPPQVPASAWPRQMLRLVVYCPRTGQLVTGRDRLTAGERGLYRHPRHDKWTWDSSEGWKLLFLESGSNGPQIRLFSTVLVLLDTIRPAAGPTAIENVIQLTSTPPQRPAAGTAAGHMRLPPPPLHPLVVPPQREQQLHLAGGGGAEWQGQQSPAVQHGLGASPLQMMMAPPAVHSNQWPGSPLSVRSPDFVHQQFGSAAQPSISSPAAQLSAQPASHTAAAQQMWEASPPGRQQLQQQPAWLAEFAPAQLQPMPAAHHYQLLPPAAGMDQPWQLRQPPHTPSRAGVGVATGGPITPARTEAAAAAPLAADPLGHAQQGLQLPDLGLDGSLDLCISDDFQQLLDAIWGDQLEAAGETAGSAL